MISTLAKEGALNKQGKPIDKGYLYRVLNNRVYLGEAVHKGTAYPGEHDGDHRTEISGTKSTR